MSLVKFEKRGGVAVVSVNNPPVNAVSPGVPKGIIEGLVRANADADVEAIVLIGSGRGFIAGADIRYLELPWPSGEESLFDIIEALDASSKPVVAAIHGHALGGGLEIAMACHYRVILSSAQVGQPEVNLGVPPGAGGTQRLPRLAGVEAALDMITSGTPITAAEAFRRGIVDEVIERDLLEEAIAFAASKGGEKRPHRRTRDIEIQLENRLVFAAKCEEVRQRARGRLLGINACIRCVEAAVDLPFDEGIRLERALFQECVVTEESKALRHVFFAERAASVVPGISKDVALKPITSVGVIGAGTMGSGIAMTFANAGIPVRMVEQSQEALDKGIERIRQIYAGGVAKGRMSKPEMDERIALIESALNYEGLRGADLVVEAVYEGMNVKKEVFAELDKACKVDAILASNTSYLDVNKIARMAPRHEGNVLGTHFFSPANVMRLLEVVRTDTVSDSTLATVVALAKRLRKLPIVSGVGHGFIGNRMFKGYVNESAFMVEEGAEPQRIDRALVEFGMAMGPMAVLDLSGLDIGWAERKTSGGGEAGDTAGAYVANRLCEMGRYGQKTGRGYYLYEQGSRTPKPDPELAALALQARKLFSLEAREPDDREIVQRCLFPLVNIGAQILEEGIALRASDVDLVYINGYGFPAWRGGPMHWAGTVGLKLIYDTVCRNYEKLGQDHWKPSPLLQRLAESRRTFEDFDRKN